MHVKSAFFSHQGRHEENEDAVLPVLRSGESVWAAIADGMGGHAAGNIASRAVIDEVKSQVSNQPEPSIAELFELAHRRLKTLAEEDSRLSGMGTTLSLIRLHGNTVQVGHVGDSRIYHLRSTGILDRTVDQTEVQHLIDKGVIRKADAKRYPRRNVLLSVLSPHKHYDLYQERFEVRRGDRLLLLTDGVSGTVLRREIRDLSLENRDPRAFCDALTTTISQRGPDDDYSAVIIELV